MISKVRKDLPGGVWNCSAITLRVKGVFWVLQFWETTSISGRKNACRDLLGKRSCQEGSM